MDFIHSVSWIRVALAVVFAIGLAGTAGAQAPAGGADGRAAGADGRAGGGGGRGGGVPEPYTPATDAKDLRAVLFNWERNMGMLKGHDERDMVAMLEYQGKGTIQVDGQPCTLTKYRASTNYQTYSQRIQYTCTRANGQAYSNIEVVSGLYAWNEDKPGAEIAGTKGKVTPMPATVQERLIRFWASPQGAPKAAVVGTTDKFWLGANPATLFADGLDKVGRTSLTWESGRPAPAPSARPARSSVVRWPRKAPLPASAGWPAAWSSAGRWPATRSKQDRRRR